MKDGKARLNPIPAFEVLLKMGKRPEWWTLIRDLRTSLKQNPLPMDVMKGLLGEAA